jgi:DNA-binding response OmpR family regulator
VRGVGDLRTTVPVEGSSILLCDEEQESGAPLAAELEALGHEVTIVCSCAEAFAAACAHDYDVLVAAPFLRDGATLLLPRTLGIRRPRLTILMTRLTERLSAAAAQRVGFDAQLTRVVDVQRLDRMLRASAATAAAHPAVVVAEDAPPASEVGARGPGRLR